MEDSADETFMMSCAAGVWSCRRTRTRMRRDESPGKSEHHPGPREERYASRAEHPAASQGFNGAAQRQQEGMWHCAIMLNYYF